MVREFSIWKSEAMTTLTKLKENAKDSKLVTDLDHLIIMLENLGVLDVWRWMRVAHAMMQYVKDEEIRKSILRIMPTVEEIDKWFKEEVWI